MNSKFNSQDWDELKLLRERFLQIQPETTGYWKSFHELNLYDQSFARRISWKLEAVFSELRALGWTLSSRVLVDWGCGSGVMSESFLSEFGDDIDELYLGDHSGLAVQFSEKKLKKLYPNLTIKTIERVGDIPGNAFVLFSHLIGEVSGEQMRLFEMMLKQSQGFLALEAGTPKHSEKLVTLRDRLLSSLQVLAPCPHQKRCPMHNSETDWCHSFAKSPSEAFQSTFWSEFSKKLGVDLRVLPFSYLLMAKEANETKQSTARHIGRARVYKGFARALWCEGSGELSLKEHAKSGDSAMYKKLKKNPNLVNFTEK